MCIAILNKTEKITLSEFKNSLESNPDGFGMAYILGGKIQVYKSLSQNAKKLYSEYSKVYDNTNHPIILHFRISTGGGINLDNTHPFHINKNLVFAHNGMIKGYGTKTENDTRHFSRDILEKITENELFNNSAIQSLIENAIGYSKLIFLNSKGQFKIYGEDLGHWSQSGNWFSNDSYKACEVVQPAYWSDWYLDKKSKTWQKKKEAPVCECDSCGQDSTNLKYLPDFHIWACSDCKSWYEMEKAY
jgi:predicted glutamine amidotransferase